MEFEYGAPPGLLPGYGPYSGVSSVVDRNDMMSEGYESTYAFHKPQGSTGGRGFSQRAPPPPAPTAAAAEATDEAGHPLGADLVRVIGRLLRGLQAPPPAATTAVRVPLQAGPVIREEVEATMHSAPPSSAGVGEKKVHIGAPTGPKTTVTLQGLPLSYSRGMVLDMLDQHGFKGHFDFVYLPCNFGTGAPFGYAFINFTSESKAAECWLRFDGFAEWSVPSGRVCEVRWADIQGLQANIEKYQNSPVMHPSVDESVKPILVGRDGRTRPFPAPTKAIKTPKRMR